MHQEPLHLAPRRSKLLLVTVMTALLLLAGDTVVGATAAAAVSPACPFCFNGRVIAGTCQCLCDQPYLPPTCGFTSTDTVTVDLYMNATIDTFNSAWFVASLADALSSNVSYSFVYAQNLSKFKASMVRILSPGFAVPRLVESVAYRDAWVRAANIVTVFPMPALGVPATYGYDYVLYESADRNTIVSVFGVAWVAAAACLVSCLVACEHCFLANTDEGHYEMEYNFADIQAMKKDTRRQERLTQRRERDAAMMGGGEGAAQPPPAAAEL